MELASFASLVDQSRSAIAAALGQIRESTVSALTYSAHIQASPPRIRADCSGVNCAAGPLSGSIP